MCPGTSSCQALNTYGCSTGLRKAESKPGIDRGPMPPTNPTAPPRQIRFPPNRAPTPSTPPWCSGTRGHGTACLPIRTTPATSFTNDRRTPLAWPFSPRTCPSLEWPLPLMPPDLTHISSHPFSSTPIPHLPSVTTCLLHRCLPWHPHLPLHHRRCRRKQLGLRSLPLCRSIHPHHLHHQVTGEECFYCRRLQCFSLKIMRAWLV